jgi:hypothetical protein
VVVDQTGDLLHPGSAEATGVQRRDTDAVPEAYQAPFGVAGMGLRSVQLP